MHRNSSQRADDGRINSRGPGRVESPPTPAPDLARTTGSAGCARTSSCASSNTWPMAGPACAPARCQRPGRRRVARCLQRLAGAVDNAYLDDFWTARTWRSRATWIVSSGAFRHFTCQASARRMPRDPAGSLEPGMTATPLGDTEGFVLPVLTYTALHAVADALRWRASTLDLAMSGRPSSA